MRSSRGLAALIALIMSSVMLVAQQPPQPRYPIIAGITVDGLTEGADMQTVIAYSGLRVGQEARPDELVMAVRNLWNRRTFKDVRIEKERETALGVFLVIKVTQMPRLRSIKVIGNDELSTDEILKAADRRNGDIISAYDEYLVRQAVKKLYTKEGLLFAKVQTTLTSSDSLNYYDMEIAITEGAEFKVAQIEFIGNTIFTDEQLASAFDETQTTDWYEIWASSKFDIEKYNEDKKRLQEWFLEQGLLDAEILGDSIIYDEEKLTVTIQVRDRKSVV